MFRNNSNWIRIRCTAGLDLNLNPRFIVQLRDYHHKLKSSMQDVSGELVVGQESSLSESTLDSRYIYASAYLSFDE